MIPTIEVFTDNIKGKYNVNEKFAHKIINMILEEYNLESQKGDKLEEDKTN